MIPRLSARLGASAKSAGQRGVSLIEAMVALAVMAFGILGVVGVQMTLRMNGDVAKQRAEAVRIAQEAIETWRGYTTLTMPLPAGHSTSYGQIVSASPAAVTGVSSNASYQITRTVTTTAQPPSKALQVEVAWNDRAGKLQSVVLTTSIAGVLPELSGSLSLPSRTLSNSQLAGRHNAIPVGAVDQGNGTSTFAPPGAVSGVSWVFSNTTGLITSLCSAPGTCTSTAAALLSGYVRFALGTSVAPTGADAEAPTTPTPVPPAFALDVVVNATAPTVATVPCYESVNTAYIVYYCAVPLAATPPREWSGRSLLQIVDGSAIIETSVATGTSTANYRVCRYTPGANNAAVVSNLEHPLDYSAVSTSLTNQNFLVLRAGDGSSVFSCPGDGPDPLINGNTLPHQPAS